MVNVAVRHAMGVRARYGLRGSPSDEDLEAICAGVGLRVECECPELVGRVQELVFGNNLCLAQGLTRRERRWLMAHGLGHWLMHEPGAHFFVRDRTIVQDRQEWQAELFAGWLMLAESPIPPLGRIQREGVAGLAEWAEVPYRSVHVWVGMVAPQYAHLGIRV